jgi:hypothetical protein
VSPFERAAVSFCSRPDRKKKNDSGKPGSVLDQLKKSCKQVMDSTTLFSAN